MSAQSIQLSALFAIESIDRLIRDLSKLKYRPNLIGGSFHNVSWRF